MLKAITEILTLSGSDTFCSYISKIYSGCKSNSHISS